MAEEKSWTLHMEGQGEKMLPGSHFEGTNEELLWAIWQMLGTLYRNWDSMDEANDLMHDMVDAVKQSIEREQEERNV